MGDYIRLCNHCNNKAPHQLIVDGNVGRLYDEIEVGEKVEKIIQTFTYFLLKCGTCGDYSLLGGYNFEYPASHLTEFPVLYPTSDVLDRSVPERIRQVYAEASQIKNRAPNAFAGQIGRALEYLAKDKDAKGNNLFNQLNALVEMNIIPPTLAEMTRLIRLLRNLSVHATDVEVSVWDAQLIDEFFRSIIEYVYIAPAKIDRLKNMLDRKSPKDKSSTEDETTQEDN